MEFFPLVALGVSSACVGTLLILIVALFLRSRLCSQPVSSPILRSNGTTSNPHCEKTLHHTGSLLSQTTNNSDLTGYRQIPQSKSEADSNPDIIPGANNFSTDYEERNQWTLGRKGIGVFLSTSGGPTGAAIGGDPYQSHLHHHNPSAGQNVSFEGSSSSTLERRDNGGSFPTSVHYNHAPHQKTTSLEYPNGIEYSGGNVIEYSHPHPHPPSDYNTIYIRDKLFHDSDIPESCV